MRRIGRIASLALTAQAQGPAAVFAVALLMPLYRFNLEDDRFIADRGVHDCLDEDHAREIADRTEMNPDLITTRRRN
jgi:hypothetical protein